MRIADPVVIIDDAEGRIRADHVARWVAGQLRTRGPGQADAIEEHAVHMVVFDVLLGPMRTLSPARQETAVATARRAARAALGRDT